MKRLLRLKSLLSQKHPLNRKNRKKIRMRSQRTLSLRKKKSLRDREKKIKKTKICSLKIRY